MPFEKFEDVDAIDNERRKAIAKSIRIISIKELKKLGEEIFDSPDRPWRETFLSVVTENPGATFYHASDERRPRRQFHFSMCFHLTAEVEDEAVSVA